MVRERGSVSLALADLCVRFLPPSQVPLSSRVRHKQTIFFNDKETENGIMCVPSFPPMYVTVRSCVRHSVAHVGRNNFPSLFIIQKGELLFGGCAVCCTLIERGWGSMLVLREGIIYAAAAFGYNAFLAFLPKKHRVVGMSVPFFVGQEGRRKLNYCVRFNLLILLLYTRVFRWWSLSVDLG